MSTESGMVLVPREPSEETLQAMYKAWHAGGRYVLNAYKAAIAEQSPAHRKPQELEEVISDVRAVAQMPMLARSVKANLFIAADMLDTGFAAPASPPTPAVPQNLEFPAELNDDLREILGRPCFACSGIAEILRHSGISIAPKAESEQATVLHWMLLRYLKHRANWAKEVGIELQALAQLPPSTEPPTHGEGEAVAWQHDGVNLRVVRSAHAHTKAAVNYLLGLTFDPISPLNTLWRHINLAHADIEAALAAPSPTAAPASEPATDHICEYDGIASCRICSGESALGELAKALTRLLEWPNPDGTIEEYYIPKWLAAQCREALAAAPSGVAAQADGEARVSEDPIRNFGARVFRAFFGDGADVGNLDGGDLQELAVEAKLLREEAIETDEGCGEGCNCIANGAGAGDTCYRMTVTHGDVVAALGVADQEPNPSVAEQTKP